MSEQPELAEVIADILREEPSALWLTHRIRHAVADWYATRLGADDVVEAVAQSIFGEGVNQAFPEARVARAALAAAARQIGGDQ